MISGFSKLSQDFTPRFNASAAEFDSRSDDSGHTRAIQNFFLSGAFALQTGAVIHKLVGGGHGGE
jgi:hypothetical protein